MGGIFSKFRSKRPSTKEILEDIQKEIDVLEENKRNIELQQKNLVRKLIKTACLFLLAAIIFIVYYFNSLNFKDRILFCLIPLLAIPILYYVFKKVLHFYFIQKIEQNEETLLELRKRKKSTLESAMETESYKIVKELLDKFDPVYYKKMFEPPPAAIVAGPSMPLRGSFGDNLDLRRRNIMLKGPQSMTMNFPAQNYRMTSPPGPRNTYTNLPRMPLTNPPYPPAFYQRGSPHLGRPPMLPMPRPVLPRERSFTDKMLDYLVGEGPSNRYALICRQCHSHNGMALKEEFEFIAFRCCYCYQFNPPRNKQPPPPMLTLPALPSAPPPLSDASSNSDIEGDSNPSDTENTAPVITPQDNESENEKQPSPIHRLSTSSTSEIEAKLVEDLPFADTDEESTQEILQTGDS